MGTNKEVPPLTYIDETGTIITTAVDGEDRFYVYGDVDPHGLILIATTPASAEACYRAMNKATFATRSVESLLTVARVLKRHFWQAKFIICGDDDFATAGNPARLEAEEAAKAIGAEIALPKFSPAYYRRDDEIGFDALDLAEGPGAVRNAIEAATPTSKYVEPGSEANAAIIEKIEAAAERLALLTAPAYEVVREKEAKALKIRLGTLDRLVDAARTRLAPARPVTSPPRPKPMAITTIEPWLEAVDGEELLGELITVLKRHVALSDEQALAAALWVLFAHTHDCWQTSPILALESPERRCGKTTLLKVLRLLVPNAFMFSNATAASIYRVVDEWHPTLLIDEADSFIPNSEYLRGVLNSGHDREGAVITRTEKIKGHSTIKDYSTWAPKIIALIGRLQPTLQDRSIVLLLRRKLPLEHVEGLRGRKPDIIVAGRKAARWAADAVEEFKESSEPILPKGLNDRARDNWTPLLTIAEAIGGPYPAKARAAAVILSTSKFAEYLSDGIQLLADLYSVFSNTGNAKLSADNIVKELAGLPGSIWTKYRGKPLSWKALADLLKPFEIGSRMETSGPAKGRMFYHMRDFEDAFARYVPQTPPSSSTSSTAAKAKQKSGRGSRGSNGSLLGDFACTDQ